MAHRKIKVDPAVVRRLAAIGTKVTTMALILDCSTDTLHKKFSAEIDKGRAEGDSVILDGLFSLARAKNLGALIWLSKNRLGYADKLESKNETELNVAAPQLTMDEILKLLKKNG